MNLNEENSEQSKSLKAQPEQTPREHTMIPRQPPILIKSGSVLVDSKIEIDVGKPSGSVIRPVLQEVADRMRFRRAQIVVTSAAGETSVYNYASWEKLTLKIWLGDAQTSRETNAADAAQSQNAQIRNSQTDQHHFEVSNYKVGAGDDYQIRIVSEGLIERRAGGAKEFITSDYSYFYEHKGEKAVRIERVEVLDSDGTKLERQLDVLEKDDIKIGIYDEFNFSIIGGKVASDTSNAE